MIAPETTFLRPVKAASPGTDPKARQGRDEAAAGGADFATMLDGDARAAPASADEVPAADAPPPAAEVVVAATLPLPAAVPAAPIPALVADPPAPADGATAAQAAGATLVLATGTTAPAEDPGVAAATPDATPTADPAGTSAPHEPATVEAADARQTAEPRRDRPHATRRDETAPAPVAAPPVAQPPAAAEGPAPVAAADGDGSATAAVAERTAPAPRQATVAKPAHAGEALSLAGADPSAPAWTLVREAEVAAAPAHRSEATPAPPQPRAVVEQISVAVAASDGGSVELRLDPPELGRVQIHLAPTDGGVRAMVIADRPETGDFLRRHAAQLAQELTQAGYGEVSLDFATGNEASRQDTPAQAPRDSWTAPLAAVDAGPATGPAAARADTLAGRAPLDIRL
jgi:flagellar hook-length control protein FliK